MMTPQIVCGGPGCKIELEYRVRGTRPELLGAGGVKSKILINGHVKTSTRFEFRVRVLGCG